MLRKGLALPPWLGLRLCLVLAMSLHALAYEQGLVQTVSFSDLQIEERYRQQTHPQTKWDLRFVVCSDHRACGTGHFCASATRTCKACQHCEYHGSAVDGTCPQDRCPGTPTQTSPDSAPPEMVWLFVNPTAIDIRDRSRKHYVDLYMYITDRGSGFSIASLTFMSASKAAGIRTFSYASIDLSSGSVNAGVFRGRFWFEHYDEGGLWQLVEIRLEDADTNVRVYDALDIHYFGSDINATLAVTANHYSVCSNAAFIGCEERNAVCADTRLSSVPEPFAMCHCQAGFQGSAFACVANAEAAAFHAQYHAPHGSSTLASGGQPDGGWGSSSGGGDSGAHQPPTDEPAEPAETQAPQFPYSSPREERAEENPNTGGGGSFSGNSHQHGESIPSREDIHEDKVAWTAGDSKIVGLVLASAIVAGLAYHSIRHHKLWFKICCKRRYRNGERGSFRVSPAPPPTPNRRRQDSSSIETSNYAWAHNFSGARGGRSGSQRRLRDLPDWSDPDMRVFVRQNSNGSGRGRRNRERDRAIAAAMEAWSIDDFDPSTRAMFLQSALMQPAFLQLEEPQPPPPISLPQHLTLPGSVPKEDVPEGQECAICMEARKSSVLQPCGHTDLCFGCAEHLWKNTQTPICPICRTGITGVTKSTMRK